MLLHYLIAGALVVAVPICALALRVLLGDEETPLERRERELWRQLNELEVYGGERCVGCRGEVEPDWLRCPSCTEPLKTRCGCGALLKLHWNTCPWCASSAAEQPEPWRESLPAHRPQPNVRHPRPATARPVDVAAAVA